MNIHENRSNVILSTSPNQSDQFTIPLMWYILRFFDKQRFGIRENSSHNAGDVMNTTRWERIEKNVSLFQRMVQRVRGTSEHIACHQWGSIVPVEAVGADCQIKKWRAQVKWCLLISLSRMRTVRILRCCRIMLKRFNAMECKSDSYNVASKMLG